MRVRGLALALVAGVVCVPLPARAAPSYPPPSVTITSDPLPTGKPPTTLTATWEYLIPGQTGSLHIAGDVLTKTTVVAVWTSAPFPVRNNDDYLQINTSWDVEEIPAGPQSTQQESVRTTTPRGGWGLWRNSKMPINYVNAKADPNRYPDADPTTNPWDVRQFIYHGPRTSHLQVQCRLVLHLEPGTHIGSQKWAVEATGQPGPPGPPPG